MLNLTKLYGGAAQPADALRYGHGAHAPKSAGERRPVVVWNITRRCNLRCVHCYSDSEPKQYQGELNWDECRRVVDDLAGFGVPAVLLSGGEPLLHDRFFELATYAVSRGLRLTLSTNGYFIDPATARQLREVGFSYVGISLDGIGHTHDCFRGKEGSFDAAVRAFRNCKAAGQKAGLRLTLSRSNVDDLDSILDFIEQEEIERVCFYHLVFSGRGVLMQLLEPQRVRNALDKIMDRVKLWCASGVHREVLTVDQPADGVYMLHRLLREDPERALEAWKLLSWNGGGANSSGVGISNIDTQGNVHPDQFWQSVDLGNVRDTPFSKIWTESQNEILTGLRRRLPLLKGRCKQCEFQSVCGGGFRVRAEQMYGDPWAEDPACYLMDEELRLPANSGFA